jgi:putative transposase
MSERFGLSRRRSCSLASVSRTVFYYEPRVSELNEKLKMLLKELATKHKRWGHPKLYDKLRQRGIFVNHKRTERLYREEGLTLRIRRRKKLVALARVKPEAPTRPNEAWAMDFVHDAFWSGRRFKALTLVDTFTKECLLIQAETSLNGQRVVAALEKLSDWHGYPKSIRVDNGPEFISRVLDEWAHRHDVKLDFIRLGKPVENAYIESFNGRFRDECLNQNYFIDLADAKETIEAWRIEYNTERPHDSLDGKTPQEFKAEYEANNRTAPTDSQLQVV